MKTFLLLGVVNGFLVVALGAFGAHGLEGKISENALKTWEKAVNYQMFHTMALLGTGLLMTTIKSSSLTWAGWFFFIGIILFSGSLYVYSTTGIKALAMITPFGGITFLIGWIILGYTIISQI
ncbi:MAG TPA: DUF423 domain-containing protein [Bacillota bacterium]|nr:DUF423 domain-containing protein [Bacillota bacterium]